MQTAKSSIDRAKSFWLNIYSNLSKLDSEDARRRSVFLILALPGGLTLLIFGIYNLLADNAFGGLIDIIFTLALAVSSVSLFYVKKPNFIFRINTLALAFVIIIWCLDGGIHGEKLLWAFCFPPMALILFGRKEGVTWNLFLLGAILLIFLVGDKLDVHVYSIPFKIRFVCAFLLLITVTYLYESLLHAYQANLAKKQYRLDAEKKKLVQATDSMQSAHKALLKSEGLLRHAQSIAHIGNWEYDYLAEKIWCSHEVFRIFGMNYSEPYLNQFQLLNIIPNFSDLRNQLTETLSQTNQCEVEFSAKRLSDGKKIHLFIRAELVLDKDQNPTKLTGIIQDITVRKEDEKEKKELHVKLAHSQKMETIGTLAGGIAHDFNNILSGILAYSQLAETNIENPKKAKRSVSQIVKGVQRAAELVQQILTFSRKAEYQKQPKKLYLVVQEALKLLRSSIPATIEIKENIVSKALILADSTQMHQVIMNLCTNAYHAMGKKGGILTVELDEVEVSEQVSLPDLNPLPGRYLKLEVKDTGHGMDKKTLEKAFDPYFTTKEVGKGTGFGLALVRAIVEEHDGYIKVDSVLGQGSRFYVYLPVLEKKLGLYTKRQKEEVLVGGTEKIMVVDDEESIRLGTQEFLEDCGYQVSSFQNGAQAFQEFKKDPYRFDLMITDMTMPQMTGYDLSSEILKIRKDFPIILCTGYSENISEASSIEIGIRKYVQKPILNQKLDFLIREELDRDKTIQTD